KRTAARFTWAGWREPPAYRTALRYAAAASGSRFSWNRQLPWLKAAAALSRPRCSARRYNNKALPYSPSAYSALPREIRSSAVTVTPGGARRVWAWRWPKGAWGRRPAHRATARASPEARTGRRPAAPDSRRGGGRWGLGTMDFTIDLNWRTGFRRVVQVRRRE